MSHSHCLFLSQAAYAWSRTISCFLYIVCQLGYPGHLPSGKTIFRATESGSSNLRVMPACRCACDIQYARLAIENTRYSVVAITSTNTVVNRHEERRHDCALIATRCRRHLYPIYAWNIFGRQLSADAMHYQSREKYCHQHSYLAERSYDY